MPPLSIEILDPSATHSFSGWRPGKIFRHAESAVEDDSDLIMRLVAPRGTRTPKVWADEHNKAFYVPGSYDEEPLKDSAKGIDEEGAANNISPRDQRADSPDTVASDDDSGADRYAELRLTFSNVLKHKGSGFVFGGSKNSCDVHCGTAAQGCSDQMFRFSFNDDGSLYLETTAQKRMTKVIYNGQKGIKRRAFRWNLFEDAKTIRVIVDGKLDFDVMLPKHEGCRERYGRETPTLHE